MKKFSRVICSLSLSLALALSLCLPAFASVLGTDMDVYDSTIHQGTVLAHGVYWGSSANDRRTENYITYTPSSTVTPIVTYGSYVTATDTVSSAAKKLEAQGYRVVGGINGDYFYTSNGVPMGLVVTDGVIRSGYNYTWAVGFNADGTALIGDPKVSFKMTYTTAVTTTAVDADGVEQTTTVDQAVSHSIYTINKARDNNGIYLFTHDFNAAHTTGNSAAGVDVVLTPADGSTGDLAIGKSCVYTVESVINTSAATPVPAGKVVLSVNTKASAANIKALTDLKVGDSVTLSSSAASPGWSYVRYITSGYTCLIQSGSIVSGLSTSAAPRTAIGQKADGSLIFYTIDGRRSGYSVGASEQLTAQRLLQLGCVTAVCLDGGGSTTMTATLPSAVNAARINTPSGGSERAVTSQIFLVATRTVSGTPDHYYVTPQSTHALSGATVALAANAVDTNYIPISGAPASWAVTSGGGTVNESGVFTVPSEAGTSVITASDGGSISGSATVHTVATPDSIVVRVGGNIITSLTTKKDASTSLVLAATYNHMTLVSQNKCFSLSVTGNIGTITPDGVFTATADGSGAIVIKAGGRSVSIPVQVKSLPFGDVPLGSWYYGAVENAYYAGLMSGVTTTTFAPSGSATRAMVVQILYNMQGKPATSFAGTFSDVTADKWYAGAVEWAAGNGIVSGMGNGTFSPNTPVTRQQLAVIFRNYAVYCQKDVSAAGDTSAYSDSGDISSWAQEAMTWAVGANLLKGDNNRLSPGGTATRAQIAQILLNYQNLYVE